MKKKTKNGRKTFSTKKREKNVLLLRNHSKSKNFLTLLETKNFMLSLDISDTWISDPNWVTNEEKNFNKCNIEKICPGLLTGNYEKVSYNWILLESATCGNGVKSWKFFTHPSSQYQNLEGKITSHFYGDVWSHEKIIVRCLEEAKPFYETEICKSHIWFSNVKTLIENWLTSTLPPTPKEYLGVRDRIDYILIRLRDELTRIKDGDYYSVNNRDKLLGVTGEYQWFLGVGKTLTKMYHDPNFGKSVRECEYEMISKTNPSLFLT